MSTSPNPDEIFTNWHGLMDGSLQKTINETFNIPENDEYIYRAEAFAMTLAQVQEALDSGTLKYMYQANHKAITIPENDILAYTTIFSPATDTANTLKSFASNAKKESPRRNVANYLLAARLIPSETKIPKSKGHVNPYYDVWIYSCLSTGFVGPLATQEYENVQSAKMTHPMLPVLYHHFGCVCPSWESLNIISQLTRGKKGVLDMASGNGYWTYMLRRMGLDVLAVDNGESEWRCMWIADTINANGTEWLRRNDGAKDRVLLMVYMVTEGTFTKDVLKAYRGDTVVVVGTQNANRYTGFRDVGVEEYFSKEMKEWGLTTRIALPSFAGKDDALYVFQKTR